MAHHFILVISQTKIDRGIYVYCYKTNIIVVSYGLSPHTGSEYTLDATLDIDIHGMWGTDYAFLDDMHIHLQSLVGLQINSVFVG